MARDGIVYVAVRPEPRTRMVPVAEVPLAYRLRAAHDDVSLDQVVLPAGREYAQRGAVDQVAAHGRARDEGVEVYPLAHVGARLVADHVDGVVLDDAAAHAPRPGGVVGVYRPRVAVVHAEVVHDVEADIVQAALELDRLVARMVDEVVRRPVAGAVHPHGRLVVVRHHAVVVDVAVVHCVPALLQRVERAASHLHAALAEVVHVAADDAAVRAALDLHRVIGRVAHDRRAYFDLVAALQRNHRVPHVLEREAVERDVPQPLRGDDCRHERIDRHLAHSLQRLYVQPAGLAVDHPLARLVQLG